MATQETDERKTSRDDFSQDVKKRLSERVGLHCSNPDCDIITKAPSSESNSSVNNIGVAAHICAAASGKGARRYKPSMTPEERSSIDNGIWLCYNCSVKIDKDENTYTEELLQNWKFDAENKALKRFGKKVYSKEEIDEIIDDYEKQHQLDAEQIKNLTVTVTALVQGQTNATQLQIDAAVAALRKGDSSLALSLFETAADRFEKEAKKGAEIQRSIGILAFLDDTQKSLKAYRRATQLDPDNADGWNELGILLKRIGELDEAINAYQTVLRLGEEHKNQSEIVMAYGNLGVVYQIRGDLDKVVYFCNKALEISASLDDKEKMAAIYINLGILYRTQGDLEKAVEYYNKGLKISEVLDDKEKMAAIYGNLGTVYQTCGGLEKAVEYYNKGLKISEGLGDKEKMAANYGNLGTVYLTRGDLDKAVEYYNKAFKIDEELGRREGMAANYSNLAIVYEMRGDLEKAVEYYNKALKISENLGYKEKVSIAYANIGGLYAKHENYKKAREYWEKSLALYKALGMPVAQQVQGWLDELPR